jgi:hypothetical protein
MTNHKYDHVCLCAECIRHEKNIKLILKQEDKEIKIKEYEAFLFSVKNS